MKILVTGALGQLGREISKLADSTEHTYIYTDVRAHEGVAELDVTDAEAVNAAVQGVDVYQHPVVVIVDFIDLGIAAEHCFHLVEVRFV